MKKYTSVFALATALAVFGFAAGVSVKKNSLSSPSANRNDSSGVRLKMLSPDFYFPVQPIDSQRVEPINSGQVLAAGESSSLKQKFMKIEERIRAGQARGEDVSALRAEKEACEREMICSESELTNRAVVQPKPAEAAKRSISDPFMTSPIQGELPMVPAETDPLSAQIRELEREAAEMLLGGGDVSGIKARFNELYQQIPPVETMESSKSPHTPFEMMSPMQQDSLPPSPLLYVVQDAPASATGTIQRFWEPGDPVGMQIEELDRQAAEIRRNGGDVSEIKAQINVLYEKLPGYRRVQDQPKRVSPQQEAAPSPVSPEFRKMIEEQGGTIIENKPGMVRMEIPRQEPERDRTGTLDENGGTNFYWTGNADIPDNGYLVTSVLVFMPGIDSNTVDVEVTIDTLMHTWDHDLSISLISPWQDTVLLSGQNGGGGDNFIGTVFDDDAATPISGGVAPFTGSFRPDEALTVFHGRHPYGTWQLLVRDLATGDIGYIRRWHLQIYAALGGEDCGSPEIVPILPHTAWVNTCEYQNNYDYACPWSSTAKDYVYRYTPSTNENVYFSLCLSEFDTKIFIYDNVCSGTPIACSDDTSECPGATGSFRSYIPSVILQAGHTYYIVVDGYNDNCGWAYLDIGYCVSCSAADCQPTDHFECVEIQDSAHFVDDCNGGACNWLTAPRFDTLQNGQTACGHLSEITWHYSDPGHNTFVWMADKDYYCFTLDYPCSVWVSATCDVGLRVCIADTDTCVIWMEEANVCNQLYGFCNTITLHIDSLPAGTYSLTIRSPLLSATVPQDYRMTINWTPTPRPIGHRCENAYIITSDTIFVGHTTCGFGNDYQTTCLGRFSGGEDAIYEWHVQDDGYYTVWLNPYSTDWTGIAMGDVCPPDGGSCIASSEESAVPHGIACQYLTRGIYYIMVDTYPAPDCIPRYDLSVGRCYNCVACLPTDSIECAETPDSMHAYHDCNGGCFNLDGIERYQNIQKNDTMCGSVFTYVRGDSVFSDMDWYRFSLTEFDTLGFLMVSEFGYKVEMGKLVNGCDSIFWQASSSAWGFQCLLNGMWWCCSAPGEWVVTVKSLDITPVPQDYRLVVIAVPTQNGRECYIPLMITDEDTLVNQTTCGYSNEYDSTCLNSYDGGEDKVYLWTVTQEGDYTIWMDPGTTEWTGIVLDDHCPPDTTACIAISTAIYAEPHGILCQHLTPGDYYIMVDTWPLPACIPDYTLYLKRCCVSCQPGDVAECPEHQTIDNLSNDCDGGCNNDNWGGVNQYGSISCGQTICGRGFTYSNSRDTDWYLFTAAQRESLWVTCTADFPFIIYLMDTTTGCAGTNVAHIITGDTASSCLMASYGLCVNPGTYFIWVGPSAFSGVLVPGEYRLTINCSPCVMPGENCSVPIEVTDDASLTALSTCGMIDDYGSMCAFYTGGEDVLFRWTVTQAGTFTVWLDPHGTLSTNVIVDNQCPPRQTDCIAHHDSYQAIQHGVCVTLPAGVYYILVDGSSNPGCIPEFDLTVLQSSTPANDLCSSAIPLTIPTTVYGSTKCATVDTAPPCGEDPPFYPGVWYTVIGTGHTITANICNSAVQWDNRMSVYACGCDRLHSVACESDLCDEFSHLRPVSWCSRNGEEYWILVHGLWGASGDFRLDVTDDGIPCANPVRCPCWDTTLTAPGTLNGSTLGAGNDCSLKASEDQVVRVLIPSAGRWKFTTCGTTPEWNTHLNIGTDCCLQDVGSSDDIPCDAYFTHLSTLCIDLPVSGVYYAIIEGHGSADAGDYSLTVESTTGHAPDFVQGVSASSQYCDSIVVAWQDRSDEQAYVILIDDYWGYDIQPNITRYIFYADTPGVHTFALHAINFCGWSVPSEAVAGSMYSGPTQPSGVTVSDSVCGRTEIFWTDIAEESGYRVYRDGVQIGSDLPANTVVYYDSTGVSDVVYAYSVAAYNLHCEGMPSLSDSGTKRAVPLPPSDIAATDTLCESIDVHWTDAPNETGYKIYRNGSQIGPLLPVNTTLFSDTTTTPGVSYAYAVQSIAGLCEGQLSAIDSGQRIPTPSAVTFCSASDARCDSIIVEWNDVADETGYYVLRDDVNVSGNLPAGTICYAEGSAAVNVSYAYSVVAFHLHCAAQPSQTDQGIRLAGLPAATAVTASESLCAGVQVCWNAVPGADSMEIQRDSVRIGTETPGDTCFWDTLAVPWVDYQYRVIAYNACGAGLPSLPDQGSRWSIPPAIMGFTASDSLCGQITLSWSQTAIPCSLRIMRDGVPISDVTHTVTSFVDSLTCGGMHVYCISPHNVCGEGAPVCDQGSCRMPPEQAPHPFFPDTCTAAQLCWTDVADEDGYRVFRNGILLGMVGANSTCVNIAASPGIPLCYTVQAINVCGSGPMSPPLCVTLPRTPPQVTIWRTDSCTYSFCWADVPNETHYVILRNGQAVDSVMSNSTCYTDLTPLPGTYIVRVCAANACGSGPLSNPLTITLPHVPDVAYCNATDTLCAGVNLTWMLTPGIAADSLLIFRDGIRIAAASGSDTTYMDWTAPPFLLHNYTMTPYNICGEGFSDSDSGRMIGIPLQVTGAAATVNRCDSVIVTWTDLDYETGYRMYRDGDVFAVGPNITRFADAPTAGNHVYFVRAAGFCGDGPMSDSTIGIRLDAPGVPSFIAASNDQCGSVVIWWGSAAGDADEYRFFRDGTFIGAALPDAESFVDSPVAGGHSYAVAAYSTECGLGGQSVSDSGIGRQSPTEISELEFVSPPICDSIRIIWEAAGGDVDGYIVVRDGEVIDTVLTTMYTDYETDDNNGHTFAVTAFNSFCGGGPTSTPIIGNELPLMEIITSIPDTIPGGQWFVMALRYCSGVDSTRFFLSLNNGVYEYLRTILPSDTDSLFFEAVTEDVPACRLQAITVRNSRIDTLVTRSFVLGAATTAADPRAEIAAEFFLDQNYPNPFNHTTVIRFSLRKREPVTLTVVNVLGQEIAVPIHGQIYSAGKHQYLLNAGDLTSGVYFYRIETPTGKIIRKMLVLK